MMVEEKRSVVLTRIDPNFSVAIPEAGVLEGADELTLQKGEEGGPRIFIDTANVGDSTWRAPLVDEDCLSICQAILQASKTTSVKGCAASMSKWAGRSAFAIQAPVARPGPCAE